MKIIVEVNGKPVEIELTADQVKKVKKHTEKITDRVKTFEDACEILGVSAKKFTHDFDRLALVIQALNEGWTPDWNDYNQYKYTPYFVMQNNRFVFDYCNDRYQYTNVGSRLCFKNSELAVYCARQFEELYNSYLR